MRANLAAHLPELYDDAHEGACQDDEAGLVVQQVQEDDDLRRAQCSVMIPRPENTRPVKGDENIPMRRRTESRTDKEQ